MYFAVAGTILEEAGDWDQCAVLSQRMGDDDWFIAAVEAGNVTFSMLPMLMEVSQHLYKIGAMTLAEKYKTEGHYLEASSLYLSTNNVLRAALALAEGRQYQRALFLLRQRHQDDDENKKIILNMWAEYEKSTGNTVGAVELFCQIGNKSEALSLLNNMVTMSTEQLKSACLFAHELCDISSLDKHGARLVMRLLSASDYRQCRELFNEYPMLEVRNSNISPFCNDS